MSIFAEVRSSTVESTEVTGRSPVVTEAVRDQLRFDPSRSSLPSLVVLLSQMALAALIYRHTLQLAFVSDAWVYLAQLRTGVWATITMAIGYHFQPTACAWIALIRAVFGESSAAFQAVCIAQLGLLAYLTYALGRRLLPDAAAAFLGSLLVIGNAAFYEISYWPLAGNMQFLAAQLYVLAVIVAHDVTYGRFGRGGPWLLALTVLAAIFTHPAMVTALPVCAVTMFLVGDSSGNNEIVANTRATKVKALVLLAVVAALFGLSRLAFAAEFSTGPKPGFDAMRAYWLVSRGLVAVFSLRGSDEVIHRLMTFGTNAAFSSVQIWVYVGGWLAAAAIATVMCLWRARTSGVRVLIAFLGIHVVILAIAGGMSSRESHVPAVPAALLTVWAFRGVAERLVTMAATSPGVMVCRQIPAVAVLLLMVSAQADHLTAAAVHTRAGSLSRDLVERIKMLVPPGRGPVNLTLVNMPGYLIARGIGAVTFSNGLTELSHMASPEVATLQLSRLAIESAPPDFANGSLPVSLGELRAQLREPSRVVLLFEKEPFGLRVLTVDGLDNLVSQ